MQWSVVVEQLVLQTRSDSSHVTENKSDINTRHDTRKQQAKHKFGRGRLPSVVCIWLGNKSSHTPVEHHMWQMSNKALSGPDLYSTMWATIYAMIRDLLAGAKHDERQHCTDQSPGRWRCVRNHYSFTKYLLTDMSPLRPSLVKLRLKPERWDHILQWPFFDPVADLAVYAQEAEKIKPKLVTLAKQAHRLSFHDKIDQSLQEGDGWLHRWVKAEQPIPPTICSEVKFENLPRGITYCQVVNFIQQFGKAIGVTVEGTTAFAHSISDRARREALASSGIMVGSNVVLVSGDNDRYINDPTEILAIHTNNWSRNWHCHDTGGVKHVQDTIARELALMHLGNASSQVVPRQFTADMLRQAARRFKRSTAIGGDDWAFVSKSASCRTVYSKRLQNSFRT